MKIAKILFSVSVIALVLGAVILPIAAESVNLQFTIVVNDNPDNPGGQGQYVNVSFRATENGSTVVYGPYVNGQSSVITGEYFRVMTLQTATPNDYDYTGCVVNVYTAGYSQNITSTVLDLTPLLGGTYYVPFNQDVTIKTTYNGEAIIFVFDAINWTEHLDTQYGYTRGYDDGFMAGYTDAIVNKYNPLLAQYNYLVENGGGATADQLERARQQGFNEGLNAYMGQERIVQDTIATAINETGGVLSQLLSMQLFGVPIFYLIGACLLIPIAIFCIRIFAHKG